MCLRLLPVIWVVAPEEVADVAGAAAVDSAGRLTRLQAGQVGASGQLRAACRAVHSSTQPVCNTRLQQLVVVVVTAPSSSSCSASKQMAHSCARPMCNA